jgi:hypothetical protein
MNDLILSIMLYAVIFMGVVVVSLSIWLLFTKSGKKYWSDYLQKIREYEERERTNKDAGAKGG